MDGSTELEPRRKVTPSRAAAEAAVRTLIAWAGDDPEREGLRDTPRRVADAYREFFAGYAEEPDKALATVFEEVGGYEDIVLLRDIRLESHCEHHIVPIIGAAHVAYLPARRVVGISKIARVVELYAKRLQTQETLTAQIAGCIERVLQPRGVAVLVDAAHMCMTTRGIRKPGVSCLTMQLTGAFRTDPQLEARFMRLVRG